MWWFGFECNTCMSTIHVLISCMCLDVMGAYFRHHDINGLVSLYSGTFLYKIPVNEARTPGISVITGRLFCSSPIIWFSWWTRLEQGTNSILHKACYRKISVIFNGYFRIHCKSLHKSELFQSIHSIYNVIRSAVNKPVNVDRTKK